MRNKHHPDGEEGAERSLQFSLFFARNTAGKLAWDKVYEEFWFIEEKDYGNYTEEDWKNFEIIKIFPSPDTPGEKLKPAYNA